MVQISVSICVVGLKPRLIAQVREFGELESKTEHNSRYVDVRSDLLANHPGFRGLLVPLWQTHTR